MAWLEGWNFRKSVTLSRASGAVSDYQMKLLVGDDSGATGVGVHCEGHALSNFYDLRFTTSDGETLLSYHRDSVWGDPTQKITAITIKYNSIGTDATTFYMYYGKSDAPDVSDDNATFSPGADFDDGSTTGLTINTAGSATCSVPSITKLFSKVKVDDWIKYPSNPVLAVRAGEWDAYAVRDLAIVIKEDGYPAIESGKMIAFYYGQDASVSPTKQVGRATSSDNGLTWGDRGNPVIELGPVDSWYENAIVASGCVKRESDGKYFLFCTGIDASEVRRIGYFTSDNLGLAWSDGGYILEMGSFTHPDGALSTISIPWVIKRETDYILLFEGVTSTAAQFRIFGATASSLAGPWTPMNSGNPLLPLGSAGAWDDFGVANPKLVRIAANQYILAYNGNKNGENKWRIGFATCTTDFTSWTKHTNNPVIDLGSGWEAYHVEASAMVLDDSTYLRFWYQGYTAAGDDPQVGLAKCSQGKLLHGVCTAAVADAWVVGSMQPDGFYASVIAQETSDPSNDAVVYVLGLFDNASVISPDVNTTINPMRRFLVSRRAPGNPGNPNQFYIFYIDTGDVAHFWDGDSWEAAATHFGGAGLYEIRVWDDGTNFNADIIDFWTGESILTSAASIAKTGVKAFSSGRCLASGEPFTNAYYVGQNFDDMFVSQYLEPEPAWGSWGAEEPLNIPLIVNGLSHANSLESLLLTQVHNLAVANLSHAQSIENVLLSQVHLLAVEALSHGHSIGGLTLSQVHQLAVNPLNHAYGIGGLTLSQVHNLLVQNLIHTHSMANVDLIEAVLLAIQDLIHGHSLGTVTLPQGFLLIVQSLLHAHSVGGTLRLTQRIPGAEENYYYKKLKSKILVQGSEGSFSYEKTKSVKPSPGIEGNFQYRKVN